MIWDNYSKADSIPSTRRVLLWLVIASKTKSTQGKKKQNEKEKNKPGSLSPASFHALALW